MRRRPRVGKIPKEHFSKKYDKLSWSRKILLRRKMKRQALRLRSNGENLSGKVKKFNERLAEVVKSLQAQQPVKVDIFKEKQTRYRFSEEMKRIGKEIDELVKFVEPYFKSFHPEVSQLERFTFNPLESSVHGVREKMKTVYTYLREASSNLDLIEKKLIRGGH